MRDGTLVRLKRKVVAHGGRRGYARVSHRDGDAIHLDKPLDGFRWWHRSDLERVHPSTRRRR